MKPISDQDAKRIVDFKGRRERAGLTLRYVEEATGVSNSYLSQLENGIVDKPSFQVVVKLHNFYCEYELV